jgi:hypothetical protein
MLMGQQLIFFARGAHYQRRSPSPLLALKQRNISDRHSLIFCLETGVILQGYLPRKRKSFTKFQQAIVIFLTANQPSFTNIFALVVPQFDRNV